MDRYLVIHEYTCPVCGGDGFQHDDRWIEANKAYDAATVAKRAELGKPNDENQMYDFATQANNAGYEALGQYWREHGMYSEKNWPLEDYPCPDCEGNGIIRREIALADALQELTEAIRPI